VTLVVSVTEVRNALRCPRIFALGRRTGGREVAFPVTASALGAAFHRIVSAFSATGASPSAALAELEPGASEATIASVLAGALLDHAAAEVERMPSYASMPAELDDLAEALRELARYLAKEAHALGGKPEEALARLLERSEMELADTLETGDGQAVLLTGRLNALHSRAQAAIDVVEYKLGSESNDELDRTQVALYRHLLRDAQEIDAQPAVLRFQPRLTSTRLDRSASDALVRERLLPLVRNMAGWAAEGSLVPGPAQPDLCPCCPVRTACAATYPEYLASRDQPPAGAARPLPDASGDSVLPARAAAPAAPRGDDHAGHEEAEELRQAIEHNYRRQGIHVNVGETKIGPRLVALEVRAGRGSIRNVDRGAGEVEHRLQAKLNVAANYVKNGGSRHFEVALRRERTVLLTAALQRCESFLRAKTGRFVVGEDIAGEVVVGDLSEPTTCHLLIGGAPGSGKSVLLQTMIASLAHFHTPDAVRFTLVDARRASFHSFRTSLATHLAHPICHDVKQAIEILEGLVSEMEDRYLEFEGTGSENLDEYNEAVAVERRMARHVVVVDEFADLLAQKHVRESFLSVVLRLCAKARAAGIHLVLASQRLDAKTVPGVIRTNLVGRIALRVPDAAASRIVLGAKGAERLLGKGDLYADFGNGPIRAQAAVVGQH
jgi:DNA segregation ATPase FtsK/SpoIIIE, S-DNA-T family